MFFYFYALLKKSVVKYDCHNEQIFDLRGYLGFFYLILPRLLRQTFVCLVMTKKQHFSLIERIFISLKMP